MPMTDIPRTFLMDHYIAAVDVSIAVFSSESLTVGEVLEEADDSVASGRYGLEIDGLTSTISTAYHKARAAW